MKKKTILFFICTLFLMLVACGGSKKESKEVKSREILVDSPDINCMLEDTFDDYSMKIVDNEVRFDSSLSINKNLESQYDALNSYDDTYDITISANYNSETSIMYITYFIYDEDTVVESDTLMGTPFVDENGNEDVVFYDDGEFLYLSELEIDSSINSCGWFTSFFKKVAKACKDAVKVVAPVCAAVAVCAAAVAVTVVSCGTGSAALVGAAAATGALINVAIAAAATPVVIGGIAIAADVVADLSEGIISLIQNNTSEKKDNKKINSFDDFLNTDEVEDKLKELDETKDRLIELMVKMLGIQNILTFERTNDKVLCIGRDLSNEKVVSDNGGTDYDVSRAYNKIGHWSFFNKNYFKYLDEYGNLMNFANELLIAYCCIDDWDFILVTNPYPYLDERGEEKINCTYSKEISIIRTANYDHFWNGYTWQTIPNLSSIYSYAGYRVTK